MVTGLGLDLVVFGGAFKQGGFLLGFRCGDGVVEKANLGTNGFLSICEFLIVELESCLVPVINQSIRFLHRPGAFLLCNTSRVLASLFLIKRRTSLFERP